MPIPTNEEQRVCARLVEAMAAKRGPRKPKKQKKLKQPDDLRTSGYGVMAYVNSDGSADVNDHSSTGPRELKRLRAWLDKVIAWQEQEGVE